ncbi:D-xylose transport system substrate-binding protein [Streptomyces sp. cf386]|uniref:sugar ABC transporter substrate-binding protein n=1 Tax=Streptomyces sp. cf386 TaxID=1761904 RepID=UPI00088D8A77|nr:substrate-binding domain-containing protein [Streptomyces sp. cf386]SDO24549.1 D-xylose transport system substrate-binding protein [Streptomyces sp. cf386]
MSGCRGRTAVAASALSLVVCLAACGGSGEPGPGGAASGEGGFTVGLLLSQNIQTRWETFDKPLIERRVKELCAGCALEYANAQGDVAAQKQQVETLLSKDVKVLILSAVNFRSLRSSVERAHDAGVPVIAYDGLVEGPISAHVSFDNERVGRLQGEALLKAMGDKADGGQIVMMNGPQTSPTNVSFKRGAMSALQGKVGIGRSYDVPGWSQEIAHADMVRAIAALGADGIDGVYAANDGLAAGVISALRAARIEPLPPVTGQDADLEAVRRILLGEQYMSVYKPFKAEADTAAEMAVALGRGGNVDAIAKTSVDTATTKDIPAVLLDPVPVTVDNIKDTVIKDGVYTVDQICTPGIRAACERAGLID